MKLYELNTKNNQQFCLLKGSMELRKENVRRIENMNITSMLEEVLKII